MIHPIVTIAEQTDSIIQFATEVLESISHVENQPKDEVRPPVDFLSSLDLAKEVKFLQPSPVLYSNCCCCGSGRDWYKRELTASLTAVSVILWPSRKSPALTPWVSLTTHTTAWLCNWLHECQRKREMSHFMTEVYPALSYARCRHFRASIFRQHPRVPSFSITFLEGECGIDRKERKRFFFFLLSSYVSPSFTPL